MRRPLYRLAAALLVGGSCLSALAAVTASLDRTQVALGETVRLQVQNDASSDKQPDIGPLRQDFEILGSSHGSSTQIVNGHISSQTQLTLVLAPKHEGTLRIPPLQWGAEQSAALQLTVGGSANGARQGADTPAAAAPVSMTATLDQKQPYVQSSVILTVRLYVGAQIAQASLDFQGGSDVLVKQLGDDVQTTESRNGRSYQVIERKYVLVPQHSGQISLKGPTFQAQVRDAAAIDSLDINSFFSNAFGRSGLSRLMGAMRPLRLSGNAIAMNVLPRPAGATAANWLPAQQVTLEESWRPDKGALHAGEPLTRHLHLSVLGMSGAQLPDLSKLMPLPDGIKSYPDQAKTDDSTRSGTLLGSRDQDVALIAGKAGHYELPAVRLFWWDTTSNSQREADLPARGLDILPATSDQGAGVPAAAENPPTTQAAGKAQPGPLLQGSAKLAEVPPWQWLSAVFALLWLGTLLAWWYSRRAAPPVVSATAVTAASPAPPARLPAGKALKGLQQACRDNDPQAARRQLVEWAAGFWPESPPRGLNAIALRLADARFTEPLRQLDRACYTGAVWQGDALAQAFAAPPRQVSSEKVKPAIPDLYG